LQSPIKENDFASKIRFFYFQAQSFIDPIRSNQSPYNLYCICMVQYKFSLPRSLKVINSCSAMLKSTNSLRTAQYMDYHLKSEISKSGAKWRNDELKVNSVRCQGRRWLIKRDLQNARRRACARSRLFSLAFYIMHQLFCIPLRRFTSKSLERLMQRIYVCN
jgi:hypothetical protein